MNYKFTKTGFDFNNKLLSGLGLSVRRIVLAILLVVTAMVSSQVTTAEAVINSYYGSGQFPTNNLNRCHIGGYATQTQNASAAWSSATDLNMFGNCTGTHITTHNAAYGATTWVGYANVCDVFGNCPLAGGTPWNNTFATCEVLLNQDKFNANPGFYTNAEIEKLTLHELGHCYSLDHATNTSVMNNASTIQTQDITLINARY